MQKRNSRLIIDLIVKNKTKTLVDSIYGHGLEKLDKIGIPKVLCV